MELKFLKQGCPWWNSTIADRYQWQRTHEGTEYNLNNEDWNPPSTKIQREDRNAPVTISYDATYIDTQPVRYHRLMKTSNIVVDTLWSIPMLHNREINDGFSSIKSIWFVVQAVGKECPLKNVSHWMIHVTEMHLLKARPNDCNIIQHRWAMSYSVERRSQTNATYIVVHTWEQKKCWTMFHGNPTSFNIIQYHVTTCNMVVKRVQHVGFNNVASVRVWPCP